MLHSSSNKSVFKSAVFVVGHFISMSSRCGQPIKESDTVVCKLETLFQLIQCFYKMELLATLLCILDSF